MEYFSILLPLAMILFFSKLLSIGSKKIGLPQVVGMLIVGILLGLIKLIPGQQIFTSFTLEGLSFLAKIGVVLIMFSAGLGTDIKQVKATGFSATVITMLGVIVPMGLGFVVACGFNGGFADWSEETIYTNLFYGVILTATSVSVTVATLKELGKLQTKVGTAIVSAAILDDIIGVILLSLVIGLSQGDGGSSTGMVILYTALFFVAAIGIGLLLRWLFKKLERRYPHNRRVAIWSFAVCFFYAYAAEKWFGVADITGAFMAGLMLSGLSESPYVDRKTDISSYLIFAPVFFANIGINTDFTGITATIALFGVCYVIAGMLGKVIGCGTGALICKYKVKDSLVVGVAMMGRAEVVLVCAQKGIDYNMIDPAIMPFVLILIIATSLLTPLFLKLLYGKTRKSEAQFLDGSGEIVLSSGQDSVEDHSEDILSPGKFENEMIINKTGEHTTVFERNFDNVSASDNSGETKDESSSDENKGE